MRLRALAVPFGMSLLLAGYLGTPSVAGTERTAISLFEEVALFCGGSEPVAVVEPEALPACVIGGPISEPSSLKQFEQRDGSGSLVVSAPASAPQGAMENPVAAVAITLPRELTVVSPSVPPYRVEDNHDVRRFLDHFQTGYRRPIVERWLVRAGRYLPMVLDVFKQKGLPEELVFTAMIESGFDPLAASRAGAKGLWQFMAPTARRYGLRVDTWLDERLDPEKSTLAAARHFIDLYAVFGSWNLAQAAYNAGERTVLEAIRAMGTSDFWALARGRWLKEETKNFIPAIQAATLIAREPERYGFVVTPAAPLRYELVDVPGSTNLKELAERSGVALDALERLNPELRIKQTPPGGSYALKVPVGGVALVWMALEREAAARHAAAARRGGDLRSSVRPVAHVGRPAIHTVRPGETVSSIARRYGVSIDDIARWNDLDDTARIFPGERLRVASLGGREETQGGVR